LSKLFFGKNTVEKIFSFETDDSIRDLCSTTEGNILLVTKNSLFNLSINDEDVNTLVRSDGLEMNSISYNSSVRGCALVEGMGSRIRFLDPKAITVSTITGSGSRGNAMFKKARKKLGDVAQVSSVMTSQGGVYFTNSALNKGFYMRDGDISHWMGTGKAECCTGSRPQACGINKPNDMIRCGEAIIIADTGNRCLRTCSATDVGFLCGGERSDCFTSPRLLSESKSIIYIMDGDDLKYFSFNDNTVGDVCQLPNVVGLTSGDNGSLFIVSRVDHAY
jgi:hypothetical protein